MVLPQLLLDVVRTMLAFELYDSENWVPNLVNLFRMRWFFFSARCKLLSALPHHHLLRTTLVDPPPQVASTPIEMVVVSLKERRVELQGDSCRTTSPHLGACSMLKDVMTSVLEDMIKDFPQTNLC